MQYVVMRAIANATSECYRSCCEAIRSMVNLNGRTLNRIDSGAQADVTRDKAALISRSWRID